MRCDGVRIESSSSKEVLRVKKIILSVAVLQAISLFGAPLLLASPKFVAGPIDIQRHNS